MVITHHGNQFFKLQFGDVIVAINPISKESKLKPSRFGADICLMSINHPDFNGADQIGIGDKQPFIISGPGEYETKGIFIKGLESHSSYGGEERINTIFTLNLDNINVCFLGALDSKEISNETKEAIDGVDLLFTPIGSNGVLDPHAAYKLAVQLEPKMIVPVGIGSPGADAGALQVFCREGGESQPKPVDKLTIKKKDLEGKEGEIVVFAQS